MAEDDDELKQALALSLAAGEAREATVRAEEEQQLTAALELSRQLSAECSPASGSVTPSAVQVRLSQSAFAQAPILTAGPGAIGPKVASSVAAGGGKPSLHLTPMRSWFSVPVPDLAELAVYPSPLRRQGSSTASSPGTIRTSTRCVCLLACQSLSPYFSLTSPWPSLAFLWDTADQSARPTSKHAPAERNINTHCVFHMKWPLFKPLFHQKQVHFARILAEYCGHFL